MNKKFKQSSILIWFLDEDLRKSAEYLTNIALGKTIDGCFATMSTALLYFIGNRNKKAYEYYFGRDKKEETMDRFFPAWPFRKSPQFRYYTSHPAKWVRMCKEHFDYVKAYFDALLDEYEYRFGRRHPLANFSDWVDADMTRKIPEAHIKAIALPWKSLKLKFRRKDIIEGYRLQYADVFLWGDPHAAYLNSNRDIPDFVMKMFNLETASMIS